MSLALFSCELGSIAVKPDLAIVSRESYIGLVIGVGSGWAEHPRISKDIYGNPQLSIAMDTHEYPWACTRDWNSQALIGRSWISGSESLHVEVRDHEAKTISRNRFKWIPTSATNSHSKSVRSRQARGFKRDTPHLEARGFKRDTSHLEARGFKRDASHLESRSFKRHAGCISIGTKALKWTRSF